MSGCADNICAYDVFIDGEKYIAIARRFESNACVQIALDRAWNVGDITSARVAGDGTVIEASRFVVRDNYEINEPINCADNALNDDTRRLFQRFRRIADTVLTCDPQCVVVPSDIGVVDMPLLPRRPLAFQSLALRSGICIVRSDVPQP